MPDWAHLQVCNTALLRAVLVRVCACARERVSVYSLCWLCVLPVHAPPRFEPSSDQTCHHKWNSSMKLNSDSAQVTFQLRCVCVFCWSVANKGSQLTLRINASCLHKQHHNPFSFNEPRSPQPSHPLLMRTTAALAPDGTVLLVRQHWTKIVIKPKTFLSVSSKKKK